MSLLKLAASGSDEPLYSDSVFASHTYTGNGATGQSIVNGIDLAGKGGLTIFKNRAAANWDWIDTVRGGNKSIQSSTTSAQYIGSGSEGVTSFNANGFTLGGNIYSSNGSNAAIVSYSFKRSPKFFDVVTFTQSGTSGWQTVSHSLGTTPGMIILKNCTTGGTSWAVYHRYDITKKLLLNSTSAAISETIVQNLTSSSFDFSITNVGNNNGDTFVAYLFAHDTSTD